MTFPVETPPRDLVAKDYKGLYAPIFVAADGKQKHLIITIHGIRTIGAWMDDFRRNTTPDSPILVTKTSGEWVDTFTFFFLSYNRLLTNTINELKYLTEKHADKKISVICHSFGTKIFCDAVAQFDCHFHHVYFIGGVAKVSDVGNIIRKIDCFVNHCGRRDYWPWIANLISPRRYQAISYYGTYPYGINVDYDSDHFEYASSRHIAEKIIPSITNDELGAFDDAYIFERKWPKSAFNRNVQFGFLTLGAIILWGAIWAIRYLLSIV